MYDYGFELPDIRDTYYSTDGERVEILIVRNWEYNYTDDNEDDEPTFKVSFNINHKGIITSLPIGTRQHVAEDIARKLYPEDVDATNELRQDLAQQNAELRMGC